MLPLDDAKTYELFAEGQTLGVFQFESSGMRDILRKAKPQRLEDLIALNALYRPGPLRGGMVDDFINRKHGRVEVKYDLPQLEPVLRETYGVIAYQEQVMRIANEVAGFTLGEADLLRKAMGKKDAKVMQAQRQKFLEGAKARKVDAKKAGDLFDLMEAFAGYGFNKSHSTTYALVAYHTAYLKANYPAHFMAALLTIESQNTAKLAMYLGECRDARRHGAAAGHQRQRAGVHRDAGRRAVRPRRREERRRGRRAGAARRPAARRRGAVAVPALRAARLASRSTGASSRAS